MMKSKNVNIDQIMQDAVQKFDAAHKDLLAAQKLANELTPTEASIFWNGPGGTIERATLTAALCAATAYRNFVSAGLAGCVQPGHRNLIIAANRYIDQNMQ